jgi:hypothetical protein
MRQAAYAPFFMAGVHCTATYETWCSQSDRELDEEYLEKKAKTVTNAAHQPRNLTQPYRAIQLDRLHEQAPVPPFYQRPQRGASNSTLPSKLDSSRGIIFAAGSNR